MYLAETAVGDALEKAATLAAPFGPGFQKEHLKDAAKLEIWCSNFNDPGPDRSEFRLIDKDGKVLFTTSLGGY